MITLTNYITLKKRFILIKKFKYAYEHCPDSEHLKDEESIYDFCVYFNVLDNK